MKRIIMIVAIPLFVILSASFGAESQTYIGRAKTRLVPEVSNFGTLTNLKDDLGRRLFSNPIEEGFSVRYSVVGGNERNLYAIGDRISQEYVYHDRIAYGAGLTTKDGLNVISGFFFDKKGTLWAIREI